MTREENLSNGNLYVYILRSNDSDDFYVGMTQKDAIDRLHDHGKCNSDTKTKGNMGIGLNINGFKYVFYEVSYNKDITERYDKFYQSNTVAIENGLGNILQEYFNSLTCKGEENAINNKLYSGERKNYDEEYEVFTKEVPCVSCKINDGNNKIIVTGAPIFQNEKKVKKFNEFMKENEVIESLNETGDFLKTLMDHVQDYLTYYAKLRLPYEAPASIEFAKQGNFIRIFKN